MISDLSFGDYIKIGAVAVTMVLAALYEVRERFELWRLKRTMDRLNIQAQRGRHP